MIRKKRISYQNILTMVALVLGVATGFLNEPALNIVTSVVADVTIKLMKLIALPLLFLSVVSSAAHFSHLEQVKKLGLKIVKYTVLTTALAALVAEFLYLFLSPYLLKGSVNGNETVVEPSPGFFETVLKMIPDNLARAFIENNVMALVFIAIILALSILTIKEQERTIVFGFFTGLLNAMMKAVHFGLKLLPVAVWAFVAILTSKVLNDDTGSLNAIGGLTLTVIAANLIQGLFILPLLLRYKKLSPKKMFLAAKEALLVAFFTRSSMATLPVTLDRAIKDAKISEDVARLSLPLCTTINMNGCAQFILLSVYFVSAYTGNALSLSDHIGMIFLAIIAAIGNAGVPMGCFFLASSILASKDIPMHLMGSILPLYAFMDMVETALNVWSDMCITKIVDEESST